MACTISTGKARYCKVQPGGIDKVYIISRFDANHATLLGQTAGVLTASSGLAAASAGTYYEFDCDPYLSSLNQTIVVNDGGGVGFQQDLELVFKGVYGAADVVMQSLTTGAWQMAVLDNTGTVYFCGLKKGLVSTGGNFGHNGDKAIADSFNYTLQFQAIEVDPATNCGTETNFTGQTKVTIDGTQLSGS